MGRANCHNIIINFLISIAGTSGPVGRASFSRLFTAMESQPLWPSGAPWNENQWPIFSSWILSWIFSSWICQTFRMP